MNVQAKIVITTALGDSRNVTRYYDNGFDCPFCNYPVQYPKIFCENPGCDANVFWKPEALQAERANDEVGKAVSTSENYCLGCIYLRVQDSRFICDIDNQSMRIESKYVNKCKKAGWRWRRVRYSTAHSPTTGEWAEFLEKYR